MAIGVPILQGKMGITIMDGPSRTATLPVGAPGVRGTIGGTNPVLTRIGDNTGMDTVERVLVDRFGNHGMQGRGTTETVPGPPSTNLALRN